MPRRPRNSGTIVRRANGRIEARWLDPATGKYRTAVARSETEARQTLRLLAAGTYQPRRRRAVPAKGTTFADFGETWLQHCRVQHVQADTIVKVYRPSLERANARIGHLALSQITPAHISALLADLEADNYKPATIRLTRVVVRMCLAVAEEWELIPRNPVRGRPPRPAEAPPKEVSAELGLAVLRVVQGQPFGGPVTVGLLCGMRVGEVLGLRWQDIDQEAETLTVRGQLMESGRYKGQTKGKRDRVLPLVAPVQAVIRAQRVQQAADRLSTGAAYVVSPYLFTRPQGGPLPRSVVRRPFERALAEAGLPRLTFHDLRHMTATLLRRLGVDEDVRQVIVGHESRQIHSRYQHVSLDDQREALERLSRLLSG